MAARTNALGEPTPVKITAIGVGALGSQVVANLVRAGFGQWTIVDHDVLLPHNLGRHALGGPAVGYSKAVALAAMLNGTVDGENIARAIEADVLQEGQHAESLQAALSEAGVVLDMSASVSVARHLCRDIEAQGRRVSLFLNPSGTALIMLAEDTGRRIPLDVLEMQLYRNIATNPSLNGLLNSSEEVRTGQSCLDVSAQIPQDLVAMHAAIGSRSLRQVVRSVHARISVWRVAEEAFTVSEVSIEPADAKVEQIGNWTAYVDAKLEAKLIEQRGQKLPNETGGVLIGAYNLWRKLVYLVDTVPSPPDSEEWPTMYIRGQKA